MHIAGFVHPDVEVLCNLVIVESRLVRILPSLLHRQDQYVIPIPYSDDSVLFGCSAAAWVVSCNFPSKHENGVIWVNPVVGWPRRNNMAVFHDRHYVSCRPRLRILCGPPLDPSYQMPTVSPASFLAHDASFRHPPTSNTIIGFNYRSALFKTID